MKKIMHLASLARSRSSSPLFLLYFSSISPLFLLYFSSISPLFLLYFSSISPPFLLHFSSISPHFSFFLPCFSPFLLIFAVSPLFQSQRSAQPSFFALSLSLQDGVFGRCGAVAFHHLRAAEEEAEAKQQQQREKEEGENGYPQAHCAAVAQQCASVVGRKFRVKAYL